MPAGLCDMPRQPAGDAEHRDRAGGENDKDDPGEDIEAGHVAHPIAPPSSPAAASTSHEESPPWASRHGHNATNLRRARAANWGHGPDQFASPPARRW